MAGRSVHIFLPDETKNDFRIATIPNWTGSIITARESQLELLLSREEVDRSGCYIMMSGDRFDGDATAYIGETGDLKARLKARDHQERGWERIAFISTTDTSFSKGHYLRIEQELIRRATVAGGVKLQNGNSGFSAGAKLGEAQDSDALYFFNNVRSLLPVLGFDLFYTPGGTPVSDKNILAAEEVEFVLSLDKKELAQAKLVDGNIVVLAGSTVLFRENDTTNQYRSLRASLVADGIIRRENEEPRGAIIVDHEFSSPSAASATILSRNDNGRRSWRLKNNTEISLGDWQVSQAEQLEEQALEVSR